MLVYKGIVGGAWLLKAWAPLSRASRSCPSIEKCEGIGRVLRFRLIGLEWTVVDLTFP